MIRSKFDLLFYLKADAISLGRKDVRPRFFGDDIWKYQRALRRHEYCVNCLRRWWYWPRRFYWHYQYYRLSIRLNFEIPPNVAGPGLSLAHRGPVIINPASRIGANCRIHSCVNIGTAAGTQNDAPIIGDDVYLGPGAKCFGAIRLADGIAVAAQAVVNKSFLERNVTIGGIPAVKLSDKGSQNYIIRGSALAEKDSRT